MCSTYQTGFHMTPNMQFMSTYFFILTGYLFLMVMESAKGSQSYRKYPKQCYGYNFMDMLLTLFQFRVLNYAISHNYIHLFYNIALT